MAGGRFGGKVALITGGAGAIGLAACRRFGSEGAAIALLDRDPKRIAAAEDELRAAGIRLFTAAVDVADETAVAAAIDGAVAALGRLDILFNNAGIPGVVAPVHELSAADFDDIVRVNLVGVFLVQRYGLRAMIDRGIKGAVVNMASSMSGWDILAGGAGYASTKHAILGLTRAAAFDMARYGIRVNAVCPGVIETRLGVPAGSEDEYQRGIERFANRIPLRRIGQPEDVAAVVAFLASDDARHVTGAGWLIDGGQTMQSWANAPDAEAYPLGG